MEAGLSYSPNCVTPTPKRKAPDTTDQGIRVALRSHLLNYHENGPIRIIEELGINHGSVRADMAAFNGIMHCYEIKSDKDTLLRLPAQIKAYNAVFDRVTVVVGLSHIFDAIDLIPDWWGITVAKHDPTDLVVFSHIREAQSNEARDGVSIARLLWRVEALSILEEMNEAEGYWSKPRIDIYRKLASVLEVSELADKVRRAICLRDSWRSA